MLLARADTSKRKRFKNEIEFCRRNRHQNILTVHDVGLVADGKTSTPFYVMRRYPQTLRKRMHEVRSGAENLHLVSKIMDGLEAAHLVGVVHRDVKPENVLVDPADAGLVLADFGIAHFSEDLLITAIETKPADRLANFQYSAPEQRVRGGKVDQRADIFALGLMVNELFTGLVPHGANYKRIGSVDSAYAFLDDLVDQMLHQAPEQRPVSIDEVKKQLIARQQSSILQQFIDQKKGEVVPVTAAQAIEPVTLVSIDWDQQRLTLKLNRVPEQGFVERFRCPKRGFRTDGDFHHGSFRFNEDTAFAAPVSDRRVQGVVDLFKQRLVITRDEYQEDLQEAAARDNADRQAGLRSELARAEQRAVVLRSVKI